MTIDSKDSRVFFRKRIPFGKQSGKQRGSDATRWYAESGIKEERRRGGGTVGAEKNRRDKKRHIYRLPSPMSRASNRT